MRVYFVYCVLLVFGWLQPLSLFAQDDALFAKIVKNYNGVRETSNIADLESALNAAHARTTELKEAYPKVDSKLMELVELREVFNNLNDFIRVNQRRDSVRQLVGRLYPDFDLDTPALELLPEEMMVGLIDDYLEVYNLIPVHMNECSYVLFNVKSEKVRNAYVLPFVRKALLQEGYDRNLEIICENVRWCSKSPETVKEVGALEAQYRPLKADAIAPEFVLEDRDGKKVKLSDFKGKHVFVGVFAGMEEEEEIARLVALPEKYSNTDRFVYLCVCLGKAEVRDAWRKQVCGKADGDVLFLFCDTENMSFVRDYCIFQTPRYLFVNQDGTLRDAWYVAPGTPQFYSEFGDEEAMDLIKMFKMK